MRNLSRRAAWLQAVVLLAIVATIAVVLFARLRRPFDQDTLAIRVGQLQSQSAEAALLARNAMADRLAPGFVRQHVQQLADNVGRVEDALQAKPAQPGLERSRASASRLGHALRTTLDRWSGDAAQAGNVLPSLDAMAGQLDALHALLEPGQ
jgi:soluble cytochrome b562